MSIRCAALVARTSAIFVLAAAVDCGFDPGNELPADLCGVAGQVEAGCVDWLC